MMFFGGFNTLAEEENLLINDHPEASINFYLTLCFSKGAMAVVFYLISICNFQIISF